MTWNFDASGSIAAMLSAFIAIVAVIVGFITYSRTSRKNRAIAALELVKHYL